MYVVTIIGGAKQGKTPFIKDYCKESNVLIFDVQNEYGQNTKYKGQTPYMLSTDNKLTRSRVTDLDVNKFIELCMSKRNTVCVFEEATMFFQGMTGDTMRKLIFSKAHTGNVYLLVFHSINSVPPRIMEATDYVILFKTNDEIKTVERKYVRLLIPFNNLQKAKQGTHIKIKMI
jgi:hypothetical protein